jgi:uncharacterized protein YdaU (DUF1376 family)
VVGRSHDAKDTLAAIPWYWRDWRASTARALLSPLARGIYRELLDALWGQADCSLPSNERDLAALAGGQLRTWTRVSKDVLRFFDLGSDGRLRSARATHEWERAMGYRAGCRRGGQARASQAGARGEGGTFTRSPGADVQVISSTPTPSPTPTPTPEEEQTARPSAAAVPGGKKAREWSPAEQAARLLSKLLGSGLDVCRRQIGALVAAGWALERITGAVNVHAKPGMSPWDWAKAATGQGRGIDWAAIDNIGKEVM